MDMTSYISKAEISFVLDCMMDEKMKGRECRDLEEYHEWYQTINDGAYVCNIPNPKMFLEYAELNLPDNNGAFLDYVKYIQETDGYLTNNSDGILCLRAMFSNIKGLSLDEESAELMIPIFANEVEDQYPKHEIGFPENNLTSRLQYLKDLVEACDWGNEETITNSFWDDYKDIYEKYNDQFDDDTMITMMIQKLNKDGYYDLHKLSVDNYLVINDI